MSDSSSIQIFVSTLHTNEMTLSQRQEVGDDVTGSSYATAPGQSLPTTLNFSTFPDSAGAQNSTNVEVLVLQRHMQEVKNSLRLEAQKQEAMNKDVSILKNSISKAEGKLGPLQKMLASLTDRTFATNKQVGELKSKLDDDVQKIIGETQSELQDLKIKMNDLNRKVTNSQSHAGISNPNIPGASDNWIEQYERQLGMHDGRIAELDARFQVLESTSYTGTLVWKVTEYHRRRNEAISGKTLSLYSQPFYTSRYGYKMCARVYLNGDGMGKGTHMSLFFVVMKGEFDAMLPWPFRQKVTFMLLDQGTDRRHLSHSFRPNPTFSFKKPTSDMNIASGCPLFIAHNVIEGSTYVKEDTIFLRIIVDTSDLENM